MTQKSPANPHGVCNFDPEADCESCLVNTRLFCHFDIKDVWRFLALFLLPIAAIWIGPVLRGEWGLLVAWIVVGFFFLQVPENYILCRHCPYYAQGERRTLLCHANAGLLKLWKFNPKPMALWEKAAFLGALAGLVAVPILANLLASDTVFAAAAVLGAWGWVWAMRRYVCKRCPNFSCPLNVVPPEIREAYLRRNPVFAEAWGLVPPTEGDD